LFAAFKDALEDAFTASGFGFGFSYRSDLPVIRIDHAFVNRWVRPVRAQVLETQASDHRPLVVAALIAKPGNRTDSGP
jgi:endonuclease/exonuclease/phosphatase (EEP) superfamily protein YafD